MQLYMDFAKCDDQIRAERVASVTVGTFTLDDGTVKHILPGDQFTGMVAGDYFIPDTAGDRYLPAREFVPMYLAIDG